MILLWIREGTRFQRAVVALLALGLALRVVALFTGSVSADASSYAVMADSFLKHGEFVMPVGEYFSPSWTPEFSHHYGPAYPLFLVPFVAVGGLTTGTILLAAFVSGLLLVLTVLRTTRSLYGPEKALLAAAFSAFDPVLVISGKTAYSENFLTMFFVLTIWAILKSLKDERFIVGAGLFAGVAYLTKGVMGWFFLIAGVSGLLWRFYYMRFDVFKDRHYLAAIGLFGAFVAAWSLRNISHFWDGSAAGLFTAWQSSGYFAQATAYAGSHLGELAFILALRLPFFAALFLLVGGFWIPQLRRSLKLSDEQTSGLWLAVGLTYLLAWVISSVLWTFEKSPIFWVDQARYIVMANVVILWLVLKDADWRLPRFERRYLAMACALAVGLVVILAQPRPVVFDAYDALRDAAPAGAVIAVDGMHRYDVLVNVGPDRTYVPYATGTSADFVITSDLTLAPAGFHLLFERHSDATPFGPAYAAAVWARG